MAASIVPCATHSESKAWPEKAGGKANETEVDLAAIKRQKLYRAGHVEKVEGHAWVQLPERAERRQQQPVMNIRHVTDIEVGNFAAIYLLHCGNAFGTYREHPFRVEEELSACLGERDTLVRAIEQFNCDFVLQIFAHAV